MGVFPHVHLLVLDGVYVKDGAGVPPTFHELSPPTARDELCSSTLSTMGDGEIRPDDLRPRSQPHSRGAWTHPNAGESSPIWARYDNSRSSNGDDDGSGDPLMRPMTSARTTRD